MSTALAVAGDFNSLSTRVGTLDQLRDLAKGNNFLKRLQLYSKGSNIDTGKIRPGHYGVPENGGSITDLGEEINVVPLAVRPKAIDLSDKNSIITSYDPNSAEFKRIAAATKESDSGCMYGTSFLIYEFSTGDLYEFFCGSVSTWPVAGDLLGFMAISERDIEAARAAGRPLPPGTEPHGPLSCTMKVRLAKNKRGHTWHVPEVHKCSLPVDLTFMWDRVVEEITRFTTTKGDEVEVVEETQGKKSRAR